MNKPEDNLPKKREYPRAYEKTIPILLGIAGLAVLILLSIIFVVVTGIFPGS
jgi:hypothetical protein